MEYIYNSSNEKLLVNTFFNSRKYYVKLDERNIHLKELNRLYKLEYINSGSFIGYLCFYAGETFFFNIGPDGDAIAIPYGWIEIMIPTEEEEGEVNG